MPYFSIALYYIMSQYHSHHHISCNMSTAGHGSFIVSVGSGIQPKHASLIRSPYILLEDVLLADPPSLFKNYSSPMAICFECYMACSLPLQRPKLLCYFSNLNVTANTERLVLNTFFFFSGRLKYPGVF